MNTFEDYKEKICKVIKTFFKNVNDYDILLIHFISSKPNRMLYFLCSRIDSNNQLIIMSCNMDFMSRKAYDINITSQYTLEQFQLFNNDPKINLFLNKSAILHSFKHPVDKDDDSE